MKSITLTLPFPPSVNNYTAIVHGRKILSKRGREWQKQAEADLLMQKPGRIAGEFEIEIEYVQPDRRRRDVDNLNKPILDALVKAGITSDDSDCIRMTATKQPADKNKAGAYITIKPYGKEENDDSGRNG